MPIYKYNDANDHPTGWLGLRVCVSFGGKTHQKYFPFRERRYGPILPPERRDAIRAEAEALHARWNAEKERLAKQRLRAALPMRNTGELATGVGGISAAMVASGRRIAANGVRVHKHPAFVCQSQHEGKLLSRKFHASENPEKAWRDACRALAKHKGIPMAPLVRRLKDPAALIEKLKQLES